MLEQKAAEIDDFIQRATQAGKYKNDPNFPNNEKLRQYYLCVDTSRTRENVREDEQVLSGQVEIDAADAAALTEPGGDFAEAAGINMIDQDGQQEGTPAPALKEAEEARSLRISIEELECSAELCEALTIHADAMVEIYRELNKLTAASVNIEDAYASIFETASSYTAWYKTRKKVAMSMRQAAETQQAAAEEPTAT
ncbi:unnamed protein product [Effrenium voratum]|uniref:Uncharacterized protein n=1 Tax=Effrenium voratum TaxID=2562239 RepID=A0AA36MY49_9DINO|nr:unnamed protein product [Effrenium voratum]